MHTAITKLDPPSIALLRHRLTRHPKQLHFTYPRTPQEAAVLVLLCTVNNKPHVVFEERTAILSSHAGEVCFPGGKADPHETLEETALRETEEELGISRNRIRVVGAVDPVPSKDYRLRVHPFVGVLSEWAVEVNSAEVHRAFVMPLEHFYRSKRVMRFRDSDMVVPVYASDKAGLEIWGLTAFILSQVVRRISSPVKGETSGPKL